MVNERYEEKFDSNEEGEYHFSDDQVSYDFDVESTAKDGVATTAAPKQRLSDKIKNHRRIVVGILVFIVLLGIVYKLVMPSTNAPTTDFSQQTSATTDAAGTSKTVIKETTTTQSTAAIAPAAVAQPIVAPVPQQPVQAVTTTTTQTVQPASGQPQQMMSPTMQQPVNPVANVDNNANKGALDRITTLEQQNSAMMNLLQTQYTQRIAETEAQNLQLRSQLGELASRVSNMEIAFRQLTKILRGMHGSTGDSSNPMPGMTSPRAVSRSAAPTKSIYSVQAIIPGRAWLKSETGDTVTVAEGDMLKGLGRITKIDPYDGIVDIDTGSKMITLSYGAGGD